MTTVHGYAPRRNLTVCGEPVHALPDMREKVTDDALAVNCGRCLTTWLEIGKSIGTPVQPSKGTDDHFTLPENLARGLLQAVLFWRKQGAESRWTTVPSRALVTLTDRIRETYPALCEELSPTDAGSVCGYVDCDADPVVTLEDGIRMCRHHAIVSLAVGLTRDQVQAALGEADRSTSGRMARLARLAEEDRDDG